MFKEISVCVNDIEDHPCALVAACKFAAQQAGRLTAIYIKTDIPSISKSLPNISSDAIEKAFLEINRQQYKTQQRFESLSREFNVPKVWRSIPSSLHPIKQMVCTDVFFVNQIDQDQSIVSNDSLIYRLILETKRPVVMIPHGWNSDQLGTNILVGWNNSPEAMRAIHDALPLLSDSNRVTLLDILDGRIEREEYEGLNHIEEYLSRRNVVSQLIIDYADHPNELAQVFTRHSNSGDFDLAVVGAYGHRREGQTIMDSVTCHLISESTIPVLFSH